MDSPDPLSGHTSWLCLFFGILVRIVLLESTSWWGARSFDDIVTFLGGVRHGRYSREMTRGIEMCDTSLDDVNTRSLIRPDLGPDHESSVGFVQFIRRWGMLMGSISGAPHW